MSRYLPMTAALALALGACGAEPSADHAARSAPLTTQGVLQGPPGADADEASLAAFATKADLATASAVVDGKLSWSEAEGLLAKSDLPSEEALAAVLRQADLAALDEAITDAQADELLVPWSIVPDPTELLSKEEAAKTFVLAALAPDYDAYAQKPDLDVWGSILSAEEAAALYPTAAQISDDHYSQTAAGQVFQGAFSPLSAELRAQVAAVVDAALAERPCREGMVAAGDVCVDRFEASVWSAADCTGTQYGAAGADDYPAKFPDSGATTGLPLYACSVAGVRPSANLTWFQADQACAAAGKRLCTLAEWQVAAAGTPDDPAKCRLDAFAGQTTAIDAATGCTSVWGAADMVGNVAEWTATLSTTGKKWAQATSTTQANAWPAGYGDGQDATLGVNGYASLEAQDGNFVKGVPVAVVRGGSYLDGAAAGVFAMDWSRSPADASATIGLRCCTNR